MAEVAELVYNLFGSATVPSPELHLPSQRQLKKLPLVTAYAVDPTNPHEIDDAFNVHKNPDGRLHVAIVIARAGLIPYTSQAFAEAYEQGWSRYDNGYHPMINDRELVTNALSLVGGELRPGLELSFDISKSSGRTNNQKVRHVAVQTITRSYEAFGHELAQGQHSNLIIATNAIRQYRMKRQYDLNPVVYIARYQGQEYGPHEALARKLVQEFMVQGNKEFGRLAKGMRLVYPHRFTERIKIDPTTRTIVPATDTRYHEFEDTIRAFYSSYPRHHEMLGTKRYTHSTSPLRRFMDGLGHQIWEHLLAGGSPQDMKVKYLNKIIDHINELIEQSSVHISREF